MDPGDVNATMNTSRNHTFFKFWHNEVKFGILNVCWHIDNSTPLHVKRSENSIFA